MTTKQRIHAAIDKISDQNLEELLEMIRQFVEEKKRPAVGIMSRLRSVQIDAPPDFATNLDLYTNGEKRVEDHLR
jgi:hypothetical protein